METNKINKFTRNFKIALYIYVLLLSFDFVGLFFTTLLSTSKSPFGFLFYGLVDFAIMSRINLILVPAAILYFFYWCVWVSDQ